VFLHPWVHRTVNLGMDPRLLFFLRPFSLRDSPPSPPTIFLFPPHDVVVRSFSFILVPHFFFYPLLSSFPLDGPPSPAFTLLYKSQDVSQLLVSSFSFHSHFSYFSYPSPSPHFRCFFLYFRIVSLDPFFNFFHYCPVPQP